MFTCYLNFWWILSQKNYFHTISELGKACTAPQMIPKLDHK